MGVKVKYFGHAFVYLEGSKRIIIDPFFIKEEIKELFLKEVKELDYVLITHAHGDHISGLEFILDHYNPKIISIFEIASEYRNGIGMNIGGVFRDGDLEIIMERAVHSANCVSYIIKLDGIVFYHAGDTAYFSEMAEFRDLYNLKIKYAFLPVGGFYTLNEEQAFYSFKKLGSDYLIPIHYNTFEAIRTNLVFLKEKLGKKLIILDIGEEKNVD